MTAIPDARSTADAGQEVLTRPPASAPLRARQHERQHERQHGGRGFLTTTGDNPSAAEAGRPQTEMATEEAEAAVPLLAGAEDAANDDVSKGGALRLPAAQS